MTTIASTHSQPFANSGEELLQHPENKGAYNLSAPQDGTKTSSVNHETQLQELLSMVDESYDTLRTLEKAERKIGPQLESPETAFSADELSALLRTLRDKVQSSQLKSAQKNLETNQIETEQNNKAQMEKIDEWLKKCADAKKSGFWGKLFGWIGKIAAVIASIAAVVVLGAGSVVTGGAAAPLMALAVVGVVASVISLADQISKEAGGPEISIGNLLKTVTGKLLKAFGVPEEKIENIAKILTGVTGILLPALLLVDQSLIGDLAAGSMGLAGSDPETIAKVSMALTIVAGLAIGIALAAVSGGGNITSSGAQIADKTMKMVQRAAQITQSTATAVKATAGVGEGASNIAKAVHEESAQRALADKEELKALMVILQQVMEEEREQLKKVIQEIQDSLQVVTQTINEISESMTQITRNMNSHATA